MANPGANQINLRGPGPWRGMTTQSSSEQGRFALLENCYVSPDGQEIRPIPGFKTLIDCVTTTRTVGSTIQTLAGFQTDFIDAMRPVAQLEDTSVGGTAAAAGSTTTQIVNSSASFTVDEFIGFVVLITSGAASGESATITSNTVDTLQLGHTLASAPGASFTFTLYPPVRYTFPVSSNETQYVWADPTQIHGFVQIAGQWNLFGEIGGRREPIYSSSVAPTTTTAQAKTDFNTTLVHVTGYRYVSATRTEIVLSLQVFAREHAFNSIWTGADGSGNATHKLYIRGLTGGGASFLNNIAHEVDTTVGVHGISTDGGVYKIVTVKTGIVSAANEAPTGQAGFIDRVSTRWTVTTTESDDDEALAVWVTPSLDFSVDGVGTFLRTSQVANRKRDFGDPDATIYEGGIGGRSRRRQKRLPYRLVPSVTRDRILLGAPGYGCAFQVPRMVPITGTFTPTTTTGIVWVYNDIYDQPRALGIPKAVMFVDRETGIQDGADRSLHLYATDDTEYAFGGTDATATTRAGRYRLAVGYRDDVTGERGLMSEILEVETLTSAPTKVGIRLLVLFPGYLMPESMALSIDVFRSELNGETLYFDRTVPMMAFDTAADNAVGPVHVPPVLNKLSSKYGIFTNSVANEMRHLIEILLPFKSDEDLIKEESDLPTIEQMPRGCKAVRCARGGFTVYGGGLGDSGFLGELQSGELSWTHDIENNAGTQAQHGEANVVYNQIATRSDPGLPNDGRWNIASSAIPPAYAGSRVISGDLFPHPRYAATLDVLINSEARWQLSPSLFESTNEQRQVRYRVQDTPWQQGVDGEVLLADTFLELPQGRIQISEPDNPGVTPATNETVVVGDEGGDIEAIGEADGQLVICTRTRTYLVGYSESPVGVPPELSDPNFGCIGANTMVTYPDGCAWISDAGPCAMIGGVVRHIGSDLSHLFRGPDARYLRDSTGMMRHAWAFCDSERALIYFGLFANRGLAAGDEFELNYLGTNRKWSSLSTDNPARSRWPCDEILIWNYRVNAWSVWRPPLNLLVKWMASGVDYLGATMVAFLGSDNRVYRMEDDYAQWNTAPLIGTITTAATASTSISISEQFGTGVVNRGNDDNYVEAGMEVLVIGQQTSNPLIAKTTLVSVTTEVSGSTVVLSDAVTVAAGDTILIGTRSFTITTTSVNAKLTEASRVAKVAIRYSLDSKDEDASHSYAAVTVSAGQRREGVPLQVSKSMTETVASDYTFLGSDDGTNRTMEAGFAMGSVSGQNPSISMEIVGGSSVRLQDLYMEVQ